ncbi:pyridoxamine 5'-phosphate oxidase [Marinobacterium jannaschii]|uniref:pyridoxamine 5'-phosphate oxidase n=1 Tax=Marinobacterium jannaschii TaxID=64970 RepID=UPI00048980F8|nr:pyridoxamine 5'-phosphate oxidase [Marinobacterium jannaschii]
MSNDYTQLRREYLASPLSRDQLDTNPVEQFRKWMEVATDAAPDDATSMTLATADSSGMPSARIVLLKHFGEEGFAWYTDFSSAKGAELEQNPQAALLFYWYGLERQVRIQGRVERLPVSQGEKYFNERPLGSRLSAAASHQSEVIESRQALEAAVDKLQQQHSDGQVPHPERWGGYCLKPTAFEFWQGRESRLHDRFRYTLVDGSWQIDRLQP